MIRGIKTYFVAVKCSFESVFLIGDCVEKKIQSNICVVTVYLPMTFRKKATVKFCII